MNADVDMSGRVEETNKPTALALANGKIYSILINARDKRMVIDTLVKQKPQRLRKIIHILVFSVLVYLLLAEHIEQASLITIDPEYEGYEALIKDRILTLCRKHGISADKHQITFERVGKNSPSHTVALAVFRGDKLPNRRITAEDVLREFEE
ncbi:MAG: hypothetical protein KF726_14285 [Anaerolineae bacterium]|nr:hypothetical protein [Anaerolineae bacterium]